jgi:hypothetical protein
MYIYKSTIFKTTDNVYGINVTQNNADKADFEANFKASAVPVDQIDIAETAFIVIKTYTDFKALINGTTILWSDVKYLEDGVYELNLISETEL